ncbi:MAG: ExbD/TolR family protein [Phycisphaerae bacterium]
MRMRPKKKSGTDAEVMLSPLIDCVFLLLIFFLVTSIIKRYERQIPVILADPTSSISAEVRSDAYLLGLSREGAVYREAGRDDQGVVQFEIVPDVAGLLAELIATRGGDSPIELVVEQQTPFQRVIDLLDQMQEAGLDQVRPRVRNGEL